VEGSPQGERVDGPWEDDDSTARLSVPTPTPAVGPLAPAIGRRSSLNRTLSGITALWTDHLSAETEY